MEQPPHEPPIPPPPGDPEAAGVSPGEATTAGGDGNRAAPAPQHVPQAPPAPPAPQHVPQAPQMAQQAPQHVPQAPQMAQQYGGQYPPFAPAAYPVPPQMPPFGYYGAPPPNDSKAVTSLVFGVLSMMCFGILAGIPAIVLGLLAKRDIGRSGGALAGGGLANTGIALGIVSSLLTVASFAMMIVPLFLGGMSMYSSPSSMGPSPSSVAPPSMAPPPAYTAPSYTAPSPSSESEGSTTITRGALRVIEPHRGSGSLERQLMDAVSHAKEKGHGVLVETAAPSSSASREFDTSLYDRRMQRALGAVDLVRIDIEEFAPELASLRMYTEAVPYFYKIDSTARPTDAISADEWDANIPQNMAPVLESFVAGTLRQRRSPSPLGTTL